MKTIRKALILALLPMICACSTAATKTETTETAAAAVEEAAETVKEETVTESPAEETETTAEPEMEESQETLVNPVQEAASLDELNEELHAGFTHPAVMGVTDETYAIINTGNGRIGQYEFSLNGLAYTMRFMDNMAEDISGIYVEDGTLFSNLDGEGYAATDEYKGARWMNVDGQYTFVVQDNGTMDVETFTNLADEMKNLTLMKAYNKNTEE